MFAKKAPWHRLTDHLASNLKTDNTYANYAKANQTFWRQTILPLVTAAKALPAWLACLWRGRQFAAPPAMKSLELRPDLNTIEALSTEREALWERVRRADFITFNEKRAAIGYGAVDSDDRLRLGESEGVGRGAIAM